MGTLPAGDVASMMSMYQDQGSRRWGARLRWVLALAQLYCSAPDQHHSIFTGFSYPFIEVYFVAVKSPFWYIVWRILFYFH